MRGANQNILYKKTPLPVQERKKREKRAAKEAAKEAFRIHDWCLHFEEEDMTLYKNNEKILTQTYLRNDPLLWLKVIGIEYDTCLVDDAWLWRDGMTNSDTKFAYSLINNKFDNKLEEQRANNSSQRYILAYSRERYAMYDHKKKKVEAYSMKPTDIFEGLGVECKEQGDY